MTTTSNFDKAESQGGLIVCYNRCLYCGRRTNHEVCHKHSSAVGRSPMRLASRDDETDESWQRRWTRAQNRLWARWAGREPEVCIVAGWCPQAHRDWA